MFHQVALDRLGTRGRGEQARVVHHDHVRGFQLFNSFFIQRDHFAVVAVVREHGQRIDHDDV